MNLRSTLANVGRVAIKLEPKILYLGIPKGLENSSVKLMPSSIRSTRKLVQSHALVYDTYDGYVRSRANLHILLMRPANFLALPYMGTRSASQA